MKEWVLLEEPDPSLVQKIERGLDLPPVVAKLIAQRGFDVEGARRFLHPSLEELHDPFLLKDMELAVDRILLAIRRGEKIFIYGDYDVDGTTGTALLLRSIKELGGDCEFYIPHRLREGYGLSQEGIREIHERGARVVITVDCGVTAYEEVKFARDLVLDVIVTDHHELRSASGGLPHALAILNPKQRGDPYPYKDLAGCGIAFKLAEGLFHRIGRDPKGVYRHLDLVALATVADIVSLTGENRIYSRYGMQALEKTEKPGLRALLTVCGIGKIEINSYHIGFILGPRINAMGRLASAEDTIRLLTTKDEEEGMELAKRLDKENRLRREIEEKILEEALKEVEGMDLSKKKGIVLARQGWHEGVIGIVASRLVEKYHRPTILIALDGDRGKGSGRSIVGFHLFNALLQCGEELITFGGHEGACGLTLHVEQVESFQRKFEEVAISEISDEALKPRIFIDSEIRFREIDKSLFLALKGMEPFGPKNPRPLFLLREVEVVGHPGIVGDGHLKFRIREEGHVLSVMGYGLASYLPAIQDRRHRISLVFSLNENEFLEGRREDPTKVPPLLIAKDMKVEDSNSSQQ